MTNSDVLRTWTACVGTDAPSVAVARGVLGRYGEPHRRYHDVRHLSELLHALRSLSPAPSAPLVEAAFWHDAVYDPRAVDNEQRSAALAVAELSALGRSAAECDEVARLVLLTAHHAPDPGDTDGVLLCDADLAVLASGDGRYRSYAAAVRSEYAHVDDASFRAGRRAVLTALLARPSVFTGPTAHARWESAARRNLEAEVSRLAGDACADPRP